MFLKKIYGCLKMYGRADAGNEQRKRAVRVNCKLPLALAHE
jgi:hypothetical protein